jgi:hypothetical protein
MESDSAPSQPLADKFLVISALIAIIALDPYLESLDL